MPFTYYERTTIAQLILSVSIDASKEIIDAAKKIVFEQHSANKPN